MLSVLLLLGELRKYCSSPRRVSFDSSSTRISCGSCMNFLHSALVSAVMAALNILSAKGQGIVGVTDKSKLIGVVTDGDIRRYLERNSQSTMQEALHETATSEMMTVGSVTLTPNMLVGETLRVMQTKRISAAFVLDDENPVGLITMLRLLNRGAA